MTPTTKNLLFLLSAAPMGLGGCIVTLDDTGTNASLSGDGDGDSSETGTASGDGDGDGDGAPGSACGSYATLYADCNGTLYADELMYCEMYAGYFAMTGDVCLAAFEDMLVCLSGLTCDDLAMDPPPGCEAQLGAFQMACFP